MQESIQKGDCQSSVGCFKLASVCNESTGFLGSPSNCKLADLRPASPHQHADVYFLVLTEVQRC